MKKVFLQANLLILLLFIPSQVASQLRIVSQASSINAGIKLYQKWSKLYISLSAFSKAMEFNLFEEPEKHKIVIKTPTNHFIFAGDNSFVIVNKIKVVQLQLECVWYENQVFISVDELVNLFNNYSSLQVSYDPMNRILTVDPLEVNIQGIEISAKSNGTMIHIYTSERFNEDQIKIGKRYNWYHVEITGARFDSLKLVSTPVAGIINDIQVQHIGENGSFEFKLRGDLASSDMIIDESTGDIIINLRTDETVEVNKNVLKELEKQKSHSIIDVIVIDPGHGGKDPGTRGYNGKIIEKNIVLAIGLELGHLIEKNMPGVKVIYTRDSDVYPTLSQRTKIANENKGKLFISIHANYVPKQSVSGFETYFMGVEKDKKAREVVLKENSVVEEFEGQHAVEEFEDMSVILATMMQSANIKRSQYLASLVQNSMQLNLKKIDFKSNGIKQGQFYVMWGATMPNILIEVGYTSNKKEAQALLKKSTQKKIADAIFKGIKKYKEDVESSR